MSGAVSAAGESKRRGISVLCEAALWAVLEIYLALVVGFAGNPTPLAEQMNPGLEIRQAYRSIANTVIYTAVADKRIRNIWGK
jgi:hypothetical protein